MEISVKIKPVWLEPEDGKKLVVKRISLILTGEIYFDPYLIPGDEGNGNNFVVDSANNWRARFSKDSDGDFIVTVNKRPVVTWDQNDMNSLRVVLEKIFYSNFPKKSKNL